MKNLLFIVLFVSSLFSASFEIKQGWNLVGGVENSDLNISKYKIVWTYSNGSWQNSIENNLNIKKSDGVWVLSTDSSTDTITTSDASFFTLSLDKGWNLVGGLNDRFDIYSERIPRMFEYKENSWLIDPKESGLDSTKGYWIYAFDAHTIASNTSSIKPPSIGLGDISDSNITFNDSDFNALDEMSKIKVLDKLYSTLFLGLKKEDIQKYINDENAITKIKILLNSSNPQALYEVETKIANFSYSRTEVAQKALARLFYMPASKEYVNLWVAYNLVNSKFFSASLELNTVEGTTGVNLYQKIFADVQQDKSMSDLLYSYINSEEHWRRFRSPEDNTREVLELQIGVFDDSLVPLASQTCQNYKYNENEKNLVIDFNYNFMPVNIFGKEIVSCGDFYSLVSKDDRVKETFADYFLNFYFPTYNETQKYAVKRDILAQNPRTYKDILLGIVLSKEYLKNATKAKTMEELYLSNARKIDFLPGLSTFKYFKSIADDANQPIMHYKLGRELSAPIDVLSSSIIMKNFRNRILLDTKNDMFNDWDAGWSYTFTQSLDWSSKENFLNDLFKLMIQREIEASEKEAFIDMFSEYSLTKEYHKSVMLRVVLDYLSQIPEIYVIDSL